MNSPEGANPVILICNSFVNMSIQAKIISLSEAVEIQNNGEK